MLPPLFYLPLHADFELTGFAAPCSGCVMMGGESELQLGLRQIHRG